MKNLLLKIFSTKVSYFFQFNLFFLTKIGSCIFVLFFVLSCQKQLLNEDIGECDSFGNYYIQGDHYISREFYDDEEGTLRYEKLFEKSKPEQSKCNPYNTDFDEE